MKSRIFSLQVPAVNVKVALEASGYHLEGGSKMVLKVLAWQVFCNDAHSQNDQPKTCAASLATTPMPSVLGRFVNYFVSQDARACRSSLTALLF